MSKIQWIQDGVKSSEDDQQESIVHFKCSANSEELFCEGKIKIKLKNNVIEKIERIKSCVEDINHYGLSDTIFSTAKIMIFDLYNKDTLNKESVAPNNQHLPDQSIASGSGKDYCCSCITVKIKAKLITFKCGHHLCCKCYKKYVEMGNSDCCLCRGIIEINDCEKEKVAKLFESINDTNENNASDSSDDELMDNNNEQINDSNEIDLSYSLIKTSINLVKGKKQINFYKSDGHYIDLGTFRCGYCYNIKQKIVALKCKHLLCNDCYLSQLQSEKKCPFCNHKILNIIPSIGVVKNTDE